MSSATQNCEYCGSPAHVWFNCTDPKRPKDWKPERMRSKKTPKPAVPTDGASPAPGGAAVTAEVGVRAASADTILASAEAKAEHLAPKRGKGRPKTIDDMKAYKAQKARDRRARDKAKEQK